jgi:flagellar basal body-associated protein FliL
MRKIILLAAVAVIAATAVVWSIVTFSKPNPAFQVQSAEEKASVSPHEMMIKQGRTIPVEYWAHPF